MSERAAPPPPNELQRLQSLRALGLLDTPPEERFDRLTRLARRLFDAPIALVSLVDADRQWFKSRLGLDVGETPREDSFCAHAILDGEVMIVQDATQDDRFRENPLVVGAPEIRFYAGCPVRAPDGNPLGTICVIDHEPREVRDDDLELLRDLADMVEQEFKSLSLATVDELTGLTNRRGFHAIAAHALAFCRRSSRPATLLLFDLDHFKQVNDRYGHAEGDRVLRRFGHELLSTFRDSDVAARLGGDEFAVLMSGTAAEDTQRPLAALDEALSADPGPMPIAFSAGVATYDRTRHDTVWGLVADADEAMYQSKRARR